MGNIETVIPETTDPSPLDDGQPPIVSDYILLRLIGQGGFGKVWLARNQATGLLRAVKVIPLHGPGAKDPAGREMASIARLETKLCRRHPDLLCIHHVGKNTRDVYFVMDLADDVRGGPGSADADYRPATLQSRLEIGPLGPDECLSRARQLLAGLASLHQAGMAHRDVKPANCLFVDGELKLADFGLVTEANPEASRAGTLKYMPPDGRMDAGADVFAAGLVLYEMVTGLPVDSFPHLGDRAQEVVESPILNMFNRLSLRACEPDPNDRFRDASEMLAELEKALGNVSERHPPGRSEQQNRKAFLAAALAAMTVLVLVGTAFWAIRQSGVDVSFVTYPFEATIYLDGRLLLDAAQHPYTTPCTVENLPGRVHHVEFKHAEQDPLDHGLHDFSRERRIEARWDSRP